MRILGGHLLHTHAADVNVGDVVKAVIVEVRCEGRVTTAKLEDFTRFRRVFHVVVDDCISDMFVPNQPLIRIFFTKPGVPIFRVFVFNIRVWQHLK